MATIGVTRGLGDHDLKVYNSNIHIKPFLSCCPEVGLELWLYKYHLVFFTDFIQLCHLLVFSVHSFCESPIHLLTQYDLNKKVL